MSRSLAAAFTTEKNLKWSRPFISAVFHFGGAVGDIYVASHDVTIGGNAHKGALLRLGDFRATLAPVDGYFQFTRMRCEIVNHPIFGSPVKRFSGLYSGIGVEGVEVDVYLSFSKIGDSTTILQNLIHTFVMRPQLYTPDVCSVDLASVSERYLDAEIGYVINQTDLPNADADDVGKRGNVIYGSVKKARAHAVKVGLKSPLRSSMTVASTTVPIHDDYHDALPATGTVQIGAEKIAYTGKGGAAGSRTLTGLTRGAGGTTAVDHEKGDTIVQVLSEYIFLAAGHEMKSIDKVYVRQGEKTVPIASASYTTELANTTLVSGQTLAIIKFSTTPVTDLQSLIIGDDAPHQSNTESRWADTASDETITFVAGLTPGSTEEMSIAAPTQSKTKSSGNFTKTVSLELLDTDGNAEFHLKDAAGNFIFAFGGTAPASNSFTVVESVFWTLKIRRKNNSGAVNLAQQRVNVKGKNASYAVDADIGTTATAAPIYPILFDGDGYKDDGSGTYTGVASALITKPADVMHHLARVVGGIPAGKVDATSFTTARSDAPASYAFAGVLTDRSSNLRELLLILGMQSRTRVEWPIDKLAARFLKSSYGAATKTLTRDEVHASSGLRTSLTARRTAVEDLINKIDLYYGRDWLLPRGQGAYKKVTTASDATSITKYGTRQQPERFLCDFIDADNATMANDLRDFYKDRYKEPARLVELGGYLDQFELLPGDVIALNYLVGTTEKFDGLDGTQKFLVEEIGLAPGAPAAGASPYMRFILREVS